MNDEKGKAMPFFITTGDILDVRADAVVVAANPELDINGGVGWRVAQAAGRRKLQRACDEVGRLRVGTAVATSAFSLRAKHVVHVVTPIWRGKDETEDRLKLLQTYAAALECAYNAHDRSVAMPLLGAGTNGYPVGVSFELAVEAARQFEQNREMDITLVLYNRAAVQAGMDRFADVMEFVHSAQFSWNDAIEEKPSYRNLERPSVRFGALVQDEGDLLDESDGSVGGICPHCGSPLTTTSRFCSRCGNALDLSVVDISHQEACFGADEELPFYGEDSTQHTAAIPKVPMDASGGARYPRALPDYDVADYSAAPRYAAPTAAPTSASVGASPVARKPKSVGKGDLRDWLNQADEPLADMLLSLIDERGLTDAQVYKRANISRQVFNKIKNDPKYHPKEPTVLALCVALELDLPSTKELLSRAGFALNHSDTFDLIVEYYITRNVFDHFEINETLFAFDQPLLGAG